MSRRVALELLAATAASAGIAALVGWFLAVGPREWVHGSDRYTLDSPAALHVLAALPLLALALRPSLADLPRIQRALSFALRSALATDQELTVALRRELAARHDRVGDL